MRLLGEKNLSFPTNNLLYIKFIFIYIYNMSDITNYGYIWYRTDGRLLVDFTKEEKDAIFQIITNYSYPCYLSGSDLIKSYNILT